MSGRLRASCFLGNIKINKKDNKLLYESKWLEPGTAIVEIEIKEKLEAGDYPISIQVKTGSLDDPEVEMNGGEIYSVLRVE